MSINNNTEWLPITWIITDKLAYGVCGYDNKVMGLKDPNDPFILGIQDLYHEYTGEGVECEEGNRCINHECEYNTSNNRVEAVRSLFINNHHKSEKEAEEMINELFPTTEKVNLFNNNIKTVEEIIKEKGIKATKKDALIIFEGGAL